MHSISMSSLTDQTAVFSLMEDSQEPSYPVQAGTYPQDIQYPDISHEDICLAACSAMKVIQ